jgi:PAS domain S-box-containing protein
MPHGTFDPQSVLAHQLRPALVLDAHGTVIAANKGSCRLIVPSRIPASQNAHNLLLGKTVSELGLVPLPGDPPVLWTWKEILRAALRSDTINRDSKEYDPDATIDVLQDTDDFWDDEAEQQAIVETDVYVTRHYRKDSVPEMENGSLKSSSMIKARATIYWLPQDDQGHFLVTFNRMSLPNAPVATPITLLAEPVSHLFGASETPQVFVCRSCRRKFEDSYSDSSPDPENPTPDEPDIAASIIPFMMATLNTDGQVINLSKSWYRFSGLNEAGSLGNGWLASMHPDDVVEATEAWATVIRDGRLTWTHQARYRKDSDGTYCWFLIRAQSYKDATGKVMRWYASMMDINEWVLARLEADRKRHVMVTLFSQTDVMLWGIDKAYAMYICEGRLDWDPSVISELLKQDTDDQTAQTDGTKDSPGRDELLQTVRAVLHGEVLNPIVEHWEGERYFRTRFVAERATFGGSVQAALALTFDITDEKAQTTLRVENQRLVNNEKVSSDANKLRGRFLANVSISRYCSQLRTDPIRCPTRSVHPSQV